jgi:DNA-binding Lrp family transcriptional regulator
MDEVDLRVLNVMQSHFPLAERPYREVGRLANGVDEADVLGRVRRLRKERIIRQISAIFDTRALGYKSSLVASKYPPGKVAAGARVINEHPGVSHNYERNHEFNLWWTIAVPPASDLEATVDRLHELSGAEATRVMYTLTLFKIGVNLDMTGQRAADALTEPEYSEDDRARAWQSSLTEADIAAIREMQEDLPAVEQPFQPMAERLGCTPGELFAHADDLQRRGFYRRFAAILYHRKAGFASNAMGVWAVPPDDISDIGPKMASFAAVSHCYQRPTYPDWPYSIFTMVHGRSDQQCEEILAAISKATGVTDYRSLYSSREYKKTRVRYFTPEMEAWEAKYLKAGRSLETVGCADSREIQGSSTQWPPKG